MPGSWDNVRGDACAVRRASRRIRGSPSTCTCAKFVHMCAWHEVCHSIMAREYSCVFNLAHACSSLVFILWSCALACDHGAHTCILYILVMVSHGAYVRSEAPRAPGRPGAAPCDRPRSRTAPAAQLPPRRARGGGAGAPRVSSRSVSRAGTCVCATGIFLYIIYNYIVVPLG